MSDDAAHAIAVMKLQGDYARFVDAGQAAEWAALFAADGMVTISDGREMHGTEELAAFASRAPRGVHLQGVPSVDARADGDLESVSPYVFFNADTGIVLAGSYIDHITRENDRLVFKTRHIDLKHVAVEARQTGDVVSR